MAATSGPCITSYCPGEYVHWSHVPWGYKIKSHWFGGHVCCVLCEWNRCSPKIAEDAWWSLLYFCWVEATWTLLIFGRAFLTTMLILIIILANVLLAKGITRKQNLKLDTRPLKVLCTLAGAQMGLSKDCFVRICLPEELFEWDVSWGNVSTRVALVGTGMWELAATL